MTNLKLIEQLDLKKMYHGNRKRFDGFDFIDKTNKLVINRYRVSFKWFVFHVYKTYADNKEHHLGQFDRPSQVLEFIKKDLENE